MSAGFGFLSRSNATMKATATTKVTESSTEEQSQSQQLAFSNHLLLETQSLQIVNDNHNNDNDNNTHMFQTHTQNAPSCQNVLQPQDIDYTLVTQLSMDRLWMIQYHCERWYHRDNTQTPKPRFMSIAVLTNQTVDTIQDSLRQMKCPVSNMDVQTLNPSNYPDTDYPVNTLRSMALSKVKTSHVMYVDVDFWESQNLYTILMMDNVRTQLANDPKMALVIPAFQLIRQCREYRDCPQDNIPKMPKTFHKLMDSIIHKHRASPFDPTNVGGHGSTMYQQWAQQTTGDTLDLPCIKSHRYEPYLAFRYCQDLPPFQTHFTGYGKNKMTWVMHLLRTGYILSQLGGAFVVHYPHLDSHSRLYWNDGPAELLAQPKKDGKWYKPRPKDVSKTTDWSRYKRGRVDALFVKFRTWLYDQVEDESRIAMCDDAMDDDAKLWIERDDEDEEIR